MHIARLLCCLVLVAVMASCSGQKKELAVYVPQNSVATVRFNMANLYADGNFKEFSKLQLFSQLRDLSAMMSEALPQVFQQIGTNSDATGMDLKSEAYLSIKDNFISLVLPMKSEKDFLKFAKKATSLPANLEPKKIDDFLTVTVNNGYTLLAWNSDAIIFVMMKDQDDNPNSIEKYFSSIIKQDKKNSLATLPVYQTIIDSQKDIVLLLNNETSKKLTEQVNLGDVDLFGNGFQYLIALNFDKDKIDCEMKAIFGDKAQGELFSKLGQNSVNARMLEFLPDTSFAAFTQKFNIPVCAKFLTNIKTSALKDLKPDDPKAKKINAIATLFDKYQKDINGDVVLGVPSFTLSGETGEPEPIVFGVVATTKDKILADVMNDLAAAKLDESIVIEQTKDMFKVKLQHFATFYLAEKDKAVFISSNLNYLNDMLAGKFSAEKNLTSSKYVDELKNGFGFISLNPQLMPSNLRNYLKSDPFYSSFFTTLDILNDITIKLNFPKSTCLVTLNFVKSGQNSLQQLISLIEKSLTQTDISMR